MFSYLTQMYGIDNFLTYYILFFVLIIGAVIGSFLNVVSLRFLAGESIVFPPSKCPNCNTKLKWYDNIPVLAYLFLKGKCRYCKKPISIQYPIVEILTSVMFVLVFLKFGFSIATPFLWLMFSVCIVMSITDFKEQIIFDIMSIPLIPIGLVYSFFNMGNLPSDKINLFNTGFQISQSFTDGILGTILAFLVFEVISLFSKLTLKQRAFGEGDTVIAMIFGAWFGWKIMLLTSLVAVLVQSLFTLPLMIAKLFKMKDKIAIISFSVLCFCAIIPFILTYLKIFNNPVVNLILILVILSTAVVSSMIFLRKMRELNAFTYLPFGPALMLAGFICVMYLDKIIEIA